jgi:hypothetical protein
MTFNGFNGSFLLTPGKRFDGNDGDILYWGLPGKPGASYSDFLSRDSDDDEATPATLTIVAKPGVVVITITGDNSGGLGDAAFPNQAHCLG